jgi:anti-sigma regulatory factor (Ser/Thr protein kinase)
MEKLTLPAKLENLETLIEFVIKEAQAMGFDKKKIFQLRLATEEALVNIINYAYPDKTGAIELALVRKDKDSLVIQITDWGFEYNPLLRPDPNKCLPLEERKIGGWGVYLIKQIMDEVTYKRENEQNILTMVKKL